MELKLKALESALLVIDVQVDFCSPDGATARRGRPNQQMQAIPAKVNQFVGLVPTLGLIVYTKAVVDEANLPDNLKLFNQVNNVKRPTQKDSGGEALYGLSIPEDAIVLEKTYADAFALTNLRTMLDERGIRNLLFAGVRTEICVDMTVRRACSEGYHCFVLEDLVATRDNTYDDHHHALKFLRNYYAFVMTSEKMLEILG